MARMFRRCYAETVLAETPRALAERHRFNLSVGPHLGLEEHGCRLTLRDGTADDEE